MTFEPGVYQFRAGADDGIRFAVDGDVMLEEWHTSGGEEVYTVDVTFSDAQQHGLSVEYYEQSGVMPWSTSGGSGSAIYPSTHRRQSGHLLGPLRLYP